MNTGPKLMAVLGMTTLWIVVNNECTTILWPFSRWYVVDWSWGVIGANSLCGRISFQTSATESPTLESIWILGPNIEIRSRTLLYPFTILLALSLFPSIFLSTPFLSPCILYISVFFIFPFPILPLPSPAPFLPITYCSVHTRADTQISCVIRLLFFWILEFLSSFMRVWSLYAF